MHYHVIVVDGDGDGGSDGAEPRQSVETFTSWTEAESHARLISFGDDEWRPTRYPGRSWKAGEIVAYLDRRVFARHTLRREVSVVRCPGVGREVDAECATVGVATPAPRPSYSG